MKEPILLIMAAGLGSRYGGLKQVDPIGPHGELIIDYSLFDAYKAGFRRVVFVIKPEHERDFRECIGDRIAGHMDVTYAFQTLDDLPDGYTVPENRVKPWGTAHAVLTARNVVDAPFAAINADDYYGRDAFKTIYDFLVDAKDGDIAQYAMVGYELINTLTDNGSVSRGICQVDDNNHLISVTERTHIIKTIDGPLYTKDDSTYHRLSEDTVVSLNFFGFTESFMDAFHVEFPEFLHSTLAANPLKAEFYLPAAVSTHVNSKKAELTVLRSQDKWFGVTYKDDKPLVAAALKQFTDDGLYPAQMWKEP